VEDAPCPSLVECLEGAEDCRVGTQADAADMKAFATMHKASIGVELPAHLLQSCVWSLRRLECLHLVLKR